MKKPLIMTLLAVMFCIFGLEAQVVTSEPSPIPEDCDDLVIYFHANEGNKGLANQPATTAIYAHTGVITTKSLSNSDWKYAPTWLDNDQKYKLEYVSPNLWKLNIGNIRQYYGITDADEIPTKLAFVFRNANGSKEGKGAGGTDIFIDVVANKLLLNLTTSLSGPVVLPGQEKVTFTLTANHDSSLELFVEGKSICSAKNAKTLKADYTFTTQGVSYLVKGTAESNGQTAEVEESIFFPVPAQNVQYPGGTPKMGAVKQEDGSVIFCIAAPQKSHALLMGSWNGFEADSNSSMNYQDFNGNRYFWTTVKGLESDKMYMYYYVIDGDKKVGDPYAKLVLDPFNDQYISPEVYPGLPDYPWDKVRDVPVAIYQENINDYAWTDKDFKGVAPQELVIYELLFRDFTGTEGKADGNGTVRKAIAKIPYLKRLGVNAVELLPINEFNGNISWGYNPNFYFAPDKAYGTPDDYKEFINTCHENGIAVILDMVFNQTDWLHPWYQMYEVGSNPFYNATAPHAYSVLNDWNQGNVVLQQHFNDVLKYWIEEYHVDGYRFDLVKGLGLNSSYPNNGDSGTNQYNKSRVERMRALQEAVIAVKPDAYFINENLAGAQEENEMAAFGQLNWANLNTQAQNFAAGNASNSALSRFYAPLDGRTWGSTVSYLESHDEQRLAYVQMQRGVSGIKGNTTNSMLRLGCAAAQMLVAPGAHMIWQFSELGNYDSTKASNGSNNTDPKVVRWNLYDQPARRGLYDTYRELIALRKNNPSFFGKDAQVTVECNDNNWAQGRKIRLSNGKEEILLFVNCNTTASSIPATFSQRDNDAYHILCKSYNTEPTFNAIAGSVSLPANAFVVIGSKSLQGVDEIVTEGEGSGETSWYTIQGVAVDGSNLAPGIYVKVTDGKATKVVVR